MAGCAFLRCSAPFFSGGGVSFWHVGAATVADSSFDSCVALRGGAASLEGGPKDDICDGSQGDWCLAAAVAFANCTFNANKALTESGGALEVIAGGSAALTDCSLSNNTAAVGSGGAIYARSDQREISLVRCALTGNAAARCGAVAVETAAAVELTDTLLSGNAATSGDGGALCYSQPPLQQSLHNCVSGIVRELSYPTGCAGPPPARLPAYPPTHPPAFPPPLFCFEAAPRHLPTLHRISTISHSLSHRISPYHAVSFRSRDLSPVTPGMLLPPVLLRCAWRIAPAPGCLTELTFATIAVVPPQSYLLSVRDVGTVRTDPRTPSLLRSPPSALHSSL